MQNKKPFEIILHVGRVTSLHCWVAKKSCPGQALMNDCSISDYPSNCRLEIISNDPLYNFTRSQKVSLAYYKMFLQQGKSLWGRGGTFPSLNWVKLTWSQVIILIHSFINICSGFTVKRNNYVAINFSHNHSRGQTFGTRL